MAAHLLRWVCQDKTEPLPLELIQEVVKKNELPSRQCLHTPPDGAAPAESGSNGRNGSLLGRGKVRRKCKPADALPRASEGLMLSPMPFSGSADNQVLRTPLFLAGSSTLLK
jgi:hypothetical protein